MLPLMRRFTIVVVQMIVRNVISTLVLQEHLKSVAHKIQLNFDVTAAVVVQGQSDLVTALYSEVAVIPVS